MSMSISGLGVNTIADLSRNQIATVDEWIIQRILREFCKGDGFIYLERECQSCLLPASFLSLSSTVALSSVPDNPIHCDCGLAGLAFLPESMRKFSGTCGNATELKDPGLTASLKRCFDGEMNSSDLPHCPNSVGGRRCIDHLFLFVIVFILSHSAFLMTW